MVNPTKEKDKERVNKLKMKKFMKNRLLPNQSSKSKVRKRKS